MTPPFPNSYWLEPGRILCGEYPRDFDDLEDHEGMTSILQAGVSVFLDLTEEGELKPYRDIALATAASLGIAHPHEPLGRYHLYRTMRRSREPDTIELVARGLGEPGGPVVEIERRVLHHPATHELRSTRP